MNTFSLKLSCVNLTYVEKVAIEVAIFELFSKGLFIHICSLEKQSRSNFDMDSLNIVVKAFTYLFSIMKVCYTGKNSSYSNIF